MFLAPERAQQTPYRIRQYKNKTLKRKAGAGKRDYVCFMNYRCHLPRPFNDYYQLISTADNSDI
ncbi:hypothetical protein C0J52_00691 [Blattella germanica]|nr:hypothetical protein C0J52_00691 [Blattella germanica]